MSKAATPSRILLMWEHFCADTLPLWDRSRLTRFDEAIYGPLPSSLVPISQGLARRLFDWTEACSGNGLADTTPATIASALELSIEGFLLAAELQEELGETTRVLYREADEEISRVPPIQGPPPAKAPTIVAAGRDAAGVLHPITFGVPRRPSLVEQIRATTDAEIATVLEQLAAATPAEEPLRVLISPGGRALPLHDRTPDRARLEARGGMDSLPLSVSLRERLQAWGGAVGEATPTAAQLIDGYRLAAETQRELGTAVTLLYPEANSSSSMPSPEDLAMAARIRLYRENYPA